jgi:hypothetical protein
MEHILRRERTSSGTCFSPRRGRHFGGATGPLSCWRWGASITPISGARGLCSSRLFRATPGSWMRRAMGPQRAGDSQAEERIPKMRQAALVVLRHDGMGFEEEKEQPCRGRIGRAFAGCGSLGYLGDFCLGSFAFVFPKITPSRARAFPAGDVCCAAKARASFS